MNAFRFVLLTVCLICAIAAPAFVPKPSPVQPPVTRHSGLEDTADAATAAIQAELEAELRAKARRKRLLAGAPGRS